MVRACYGYEYGRSVGHVVRPKSKLRRWWYSFGRRFRMPVRRFRNKCGLHWEEKTVISMEYWKINEVARRRLRAYTTAATATGAHAGVDITFLWYVRTYNHPWKCVREDHGNDNMVWRSSREDFSWDRRNSLGKVCCAAAFTILKPECTGLFSAKMVTGQEHVLLTATLDSQCHCDSCKVHQRVSLEVMEQRGLALVSRYFTTAIQHPGMSSLVSLLRRSLAGIMWIWRGSLSGSSPGCYWSVIQFPWKKTSVLWSKHWQGFQPVPS